ncbi:hypothetical protein BC940DRAFT_306053 [Gongronella butleri]|nr:hypothetical protein BC940DRAFT_306053 [Gongronella butleri]
MSLSDFLADDSGSSSWADEMADLPSAPAGRDDGMMGGAPRSPFDRGNDMDMPRGPARGNRFESNDRDRFPPREGRRESQDRGFGGPRDREPRAFPPRTPVAMPTEPPFTAHVANLAFEVNEDDVAQFFENQKIANIRILRDRTERSKGYGYVEFEDLESLKGAMELSNQEMMGRPVRINVAEPPKERPGMDRPDRPDRTNVSSWRREGPISLPERQDRGFERGGDRFAEGPRRGGFRDRQERPERTFMDRRGDTSWSGGAFSRRGDAERERPKERPRMNLKPRGASDDAAARPAAPAGNKPSPFGEAKPVDTTKVLEQVEKKMSHVAIDDAKAPAATETEEKQ